MAIQQTLGCVIDVQLIVVAKRVIMRVLKRRSPERHKIEAGDMIDSNSDYFGSGPESNNSIKLIYFSGTLAALIRLDPCLHELGLGRSRSIHCCNSRSMRGEQPITPFF